MIILVKISVVVPVHFMLIRTFASYNRFVSAAFWRIEVYYLISVDVQFES